MNPDIAKRIFLSLLTLIFIFLPIHLVQGASEENLTIVFTSGMAEIYLDKDQGGHAHLQTFLKKVRSANKRVLFIHGGDTLSPGILSTIDQGGHIISILNSLEPDVMAVSKSDLAHHEDALSLRSFEAAFPLINCNLYDPLTGSQPEGILPYFMQRVGEYNIGFLSVIDPEVISDYIPERVTTVEMNKAVAINAKKLRKQGADIVILIAGLSVEAFNSYLYNPPVDIVLLGHTTGKTGLTQQGNSLFVFSGHEGMASLISLRLKKTETVTTWTSMGQIVRLSDFGPDPQITEIIDSNLSQLTEMLSRILATTKIEFDTRRQSMRTGENGFANLAADAIRKHYGSDIAIINGGGFRANRIYPSGTKIRVGDIQKELPFNNRVVNLRVSGEVLSKTLERGLSRIKEQKGCFPHVSGMRVLYDPEKPPMERIISVLIDGQELEPEKKYTLATIDYMAKGGDGFLELKEAERLVKIGKNRLLWEYIHNYIKDLGVISPEADGRMKAIDE